MNRRYQEQTKPTACCHFTDPQLSRDGIERTPVVFLNEEQRTQGGLPCLELCTDSTGNRKAVLLNSGAACVSEGPCRLQRKEGLCPRGLRL